MDTESELQRDASTLDTPLLYACSILSCDSPTVEDLGDLTPCEKCKRRVCEGHARKRSVFYLCADCDQTERMLMELLIAPSLMEIASKLRAASLNAEELQFELTQLGNQASEIEADV